MQIGISQLVVRDLSLAEFTHQSIAAGYEVAELLLRREGELTPETSDEALKRFAADMRAAGLEPVSMVHGQMTGNLLDSGEAARRAIEETRRGLEVAAAMGIGCTLHTLGSLRSDLYYDVAYDNAISNLREVAEFAEKLGVVLAIEFVWNGFLFSPLEMRRFLDEVNSPYIGFYFDPGNMAVFHHPHHWVKIVGPHLKMVHLKDWKGGPLDGGWPALLEGTIDYAAMNRELRAIGYDGPMISEVPPADAPLDVTAASIRKIIAM